MCSPFLFFVGASALVIAPKRCGSTYAKKGLQFLVTKKRSSASKTLSEDAGQDRQGKSLIADFKGIANRQKKLAKTFLGVILEL